MNKPRFLELVRNPDRLEFFDLEKLEEVVAAFPYFQAAHLLIAKIAKEQSSMFAGEKLNRAGVCTLDRKNLKKWMQIKPRKLTVFINHEPEVKNIEVAEEISKENVTLESGIKIQLSPQRVVERELPENAIEKPPVVHLSKEEATEEAVEKIEEITEEKAAEIIEEKAEEEKVEEGYIAEKVEEKVEEESEEKEANILPVNNANTGEWKKELDRKVELHDGNKIPENDLLIPQPLTFITVREEEIKREAEQPEQKIEKINLPTPPDQPLDFYAELQQNLEKLRLNKEAAFPLHLPDDMVEKEATNVAEDKEVEIIADKNLEETPNSALSAEPPAEIDKVGPEQLEIEEPKTSFGSVSTTLDESRLEEILRNDISEQNDISQKDLLIEYFNYLAQRRIARMNDKRSINIILDKFIAKEPSIPKLKPETPKTPLVDLAEKSTRSGNKIISENFAKILVLQGKIDKAIEMYEELSLKNPEKKAYFANLILELKNKNNP